MSSQTLRVLVVSQDRKLLRQMSRFLNMFGYRVLQVAEMQQVRAALASHRPQVMILDAGDDEKAVRQLCEQASDSDSPNYVHTMLLLNDVAPRAVADAVSAGVDDFLQKPVVYGELLTRLRAGVRAVEQERRIGQQEGTDRLTGLSNREAFSLLLQQRTGNNADLACVAVDVDLLDHINRLHGLECGDETIRIVAGWLADACGDGASVGSFGGGRFAVLLGDSSLEAARAWAEQAREAIAKLEIPGTETTTRITASFGVSVGTADQLLRSAEEALTAAKHSGRDCVVCYGQFDDEQQVWNELAASGKIFEQTEAQHVMSAAPVLLSQDETAGRAAALLERTQLHTLVVVDRDARLVGAVSAETDLADAQTAVREVMDANVAAFEENTSLAELLEYFTRESSTLAVIVRHGRPAGVVTREQLAVLSEAVALDRFAPSAPFSNTSEYLVVLDRALTGNTW